MLYEKVLVQYLCLGPGDVEVFLSETQLQDHMSQCISQVLQYLWLGNSFQE